MEKAKCDDDDCVNAGGAVRKGIARKQRFDGAKGILKLEGEALAGH